ncbi:MAG: hypothetical protein ACE5ID_08550, partial [Acidobacteriota bacterium]
MRRIRSSSLVLVITILVFSSPLSTGGEDRYQEWLSRATAQAIQGHLYKARLWLNRIPLEARAVPHHSSDRSSKHSPARLLAEKWMILDAYLSPGQKDPFHLLTELLDSESWSWREMDPFSSAQWHRLLARFARRE